MNPALLRAEFLPSWLLSALAGIALKEGVQHGAQELVKRRRARQLRARRTLLESGASYGWLMEYYRRTGASKELFECRIGNTSATIPFFAPKQWIGPPRSALCDDGILLHTKGMPEQGPINRKMLALRSKLGQNLFDDPALYICGIEDDATSTIVHAKTCSYYEAMSTLIELEEETFRAMRRKRRARTPVRDDLCADLAALRAIGSRRRSLGCQVVLALEGNDRFQIVVHTRSYRTITYGGAKSAIPAYGMAPVPGEPAARDVLFYNFIKEYCEELYDCEELVRAGTEARLDPRWFYHHIPAARQLIAWRDRGQLVFERLGFGFDALNGSATIALLAIIRDSTAAARLGPEIRTCWEVARRSEEPEPICLVDYEDEILERWLVNKRLHWGAAFAICLAVRRLCELSRGGNPAAS